MALGLACLGLALPFLIFVGPAVLDLRASFDPAAARYKDFTQEYLLARAMLDGVNPYIPLPELVNQYLGQIGPVNKSLPTPHPPPDGLLFLPLALLNYETAVRVWFVVELICLLVGTTVAVRAGRLPLNWRLAPLLTLLLIGWVPVSTDLVLGQLTVPMLAALAVAQTLLLRGRELSGGAFLGLALLMKPLAWPWLIALVYRRHWRAIFSVLVVVLLGYTVAIVRFGVTPIRNYFTEVLPTVSAAYAAEPLNMSLWTVGPRLLRGAGGDVLRIGLPSMVLLLAIAWLVRNDPPLPSALGVMLCMSVLINPVSWPYNLVLAIIPAAHVIRYLCVRAFPPLATALALLVGILLFVPDQAWPESLSLTPALAIGALALLLVWLTPRSEIVRTALDPPGVARGARTAPGAAR